jgi:hypothetical protein
MIGEAMERILKRRKIRTEMKGKKRHVKKRG